jgi:dipeptidyl aminopeptidase/acylaminoacyl peptidase
VLLAAAIVSGGSARGNDRVVAALDALPQAKSIDAVAISPDGQRVAYIVEGQLSVAGVADGNARRIAAAQSKTRDVSWSNDSRHLCWLEDLPGDAPAAKLWRASADGSDLEQLGDFKGYAQLPHYSPDQNKMAVLFIEGMPRVAGPLQPMTPLAGVVGETIYEQRLAVVDLQSKRIKQVTPADVYIYEYDWMPDSQGWAAIAAQGSGDNNWWIARLYRINADSGEMQEIYKPKWQIADPHVSSDGKSVALIEGLMSDEGLTGGEVQLVRLSGGKARNLTPGINASPSAISWSGNDRINVVANVDGNSGITEIPSTGMGSAAWNGWIGHEMISTISDPFVPTASFSRDGSVSGVVRQSGTTPPEVWAGPSGKWKQITTVNQDLHATWGESRNVHWMNGETRVQGWLRMPKDYDASKKYPLIVSVHGGPSWACTSKWDAGGMGGMTAASLLGWFVLCPNPRGSFGQGEAFTQGDVRDFGNRDYHDIMAGVDAMLKQFPIDDKKIGIRGHSYGGYMTMWAETQTDRFAAAVAGAGLSDWQSYYGLNDIDEWMLPFFGASVYDDPAVYAKSDPIRFVKKVRTPTLLLVGDRDGEVPMEQSLEWYHALKSFKVPTELVVYPDEGHLFNKPADSRDYTLRMLQWFDDWFSKTRQ